MKQKDIAVLILAGGFSAIVSFIIAGIIFSPKKYSAQVPVAEVVDSNFPDVVNDSTYNSFLNPKALDLTVPVQIGDSENNDPFSGN